MSRKLDTVGAPEQFRFEERMPDVFSWHLVDEKLDWPAHLGDGNGIPEAALKSLKSALDSLSKPIPELPDRDKIIDAFRFGAPLLRLNWRQLDNSEHLVFSSDPTIIDGGKRVGGRIVEIDDAGRVRVLRVHGGDEDSPVSQAEFHLKYDDDGYASELFTWNYVKPNTTDQFIYDISDDGSRTVQSLARTIHSLRYEDEMPIQADLRSFVSKK
jgi:hypothetical protein